ncbi:hypothetical protein [Undibacter mobilis]|uniref:Uncharacterized protein n=1 Tax=Undibacter mobilis TaxID=2292256 RepID=A0A371B1J4_9BRAD|nr:hypothetical protein [Undibacter mobilis]RDV01323.1 hypothetical protein DXH78_19045 [Undibacter mobilis]
MSQELKTRLGIASLVGLMVNAVLFGAGLIVILMVPALNAQAFAALPVMILISFAIAAPISWAIAPRLQARYWRGRESDFIAG